MSKNKIKMVLIISACLLLVTLIVCGVFCRSKNEGNTRLYHAVRNHVEEHGEAIVTLSELTNFEWDKAVYFHNTSPNTIYETVGVLFEETDLTTGILFINEGEIVYYEIFPKKTSGWIDRHPVKLYMHHAGYAVSVFGQNDMFEIGISEDYFGDILFWIRIQ